MTIICSDGKTMAADGRSTIGDLITTDEARKVVRMPDGSVAGVAGDRAACQLVREWLEKGADLACIPRVHESTPGESPFDALILRPDGRLERMERHFTPCPVSAPHAIGSGGEVALGAMLAGKTPEEAVALACSVGTSVGGTITVLKPGKEPQ